jgi:integral membrane sensor domain MASE1
MPNHVFRNFRFRKFFLVLSTAILYYLFARLSLMLQFQTSNATPVWIPSGFAFAAMLLCGRQIMPGILVGAFLANFTVFISNGATSLSSAVLLSLFIGAGNTGEALAGNYLLRKMIRYQHLQEIFSPLWRKSDEIAMRAVTCATKLFNYYLASAAVII